MTQIELSQIRKSYGTTEVIRDISFSVMPGEFVVLVGPSGCGKSTLLRMIAGLEEISGGDLQIGGTRMNDTEPAERGVAMVFQSYALYPHMSVAENMSFSLRMAKRPQAEIKEKVESAAKILQLDQLLQRKPGQLSGGQRQRVAIGRAIVRNPDVFLFDEPLSNLDAELRVQMRVEIARLHKTLGNTIVYVTHDQTEAMTLADRIVVLRDGRIEQIGSPLQLYRDPDNAFVAGFMGAPRMNFFAAVATGANSIRLGDASVSLGNLATILNEGQALQCGIRPEHLDEERGIALPCQIDLVEQMGATSYLHGKLDNGAAVIAEHRASELTAGQATVLHADPERICLFDADGNRLR